jgi:hypothetical protein
LKENPVLDRQAAFDRVYDTFVTRSLPRSLARIGARGNGCTYDGDMVSPGHPGCAFACLLPKPLTVRLEQQFGGNTVRAIFDVVTRFPESMESKRRRLVGEILVHLNMSPDDPDFGKDVGFLSALQSWHDSGNTTPEQLIALGLKYNLTVPTPA